MVQRPLMMLYCPPEKNQKLLTVYSVWEGKHEGGDLHLAHSLK